MALELRLFSAFTWHEGDVKQNLAEVLRMVNGFILGGGGFKLGTELPRSEIGADGDTAPSALGG